MTAKWTPEEEAALRAIADGEEGRDHGDGADSLGATEQQPSEPSGQGQEAADAPGKGLLGQGYG